MLQTDNHQQVSVVLATIIRVSQKILIKYTINRLSAKVKAFDVMVNMMGSPCNVLLVYILLKQIRTVVKIDKTGCVCVVECSSYALF